jgi:hypothetical protein
VREDGLFHLFDVLLGTGAGKELLHNDEVRQAYLGFAPAVRK